MEEQRKTVWGSAGRGVAAAISCGVRVAGAALVVGTLACANMKAPAEQAVNAADAALASVSGEASTYVPGELKSAQDTLVAAKTSLEHGDYQTALATAQQIPEKVNALRTAIASKKAELTKSWDEMSSVPRMVEAIKARVTGLSAVKRLPSGVSVDSLNEAKGSLATLTQTWTAASTAFQSGNLPDAVAKATAVKEQATNIMAVLKMPVAEAAK